MAGGAGAYHRRKKRDANDYQQLSHVSSSQASSSSASSSPAPPSVKDLKGKLYVADEADDVEEEISMKVIFKIMVAVRVSGALWTGISDCDEVYNYWEPLHLLLTNEGFQTWEYSPVYALRSYLYVGLHLLPAKAIQLLLPAFSKVGVFFGVRLVLALFAAAVEFYLYNVLHRRVGTAIARNYVICSMISPGLYHASVAFLPSTFSMQMNALAVAAWLDHRAYFSVLCTAISALVGWPFAAVLGLPIVLEMLLVRRELLKFGGFAVLAGAKVLLLLVMTDSYYYGKFVLAPLNIVLYNVFSSHGPDLYGVEPWTYYVKNLLLNWNVMLLLAPLALPLSALVYVRMFPKRESSLRYWRRFLPVVFISASVALWLAIFFKQPHKEERFLFPVYPLIAVLAAITFDALTRGGWAYFGNRFSKKMSYFAGCVMAVCILIFLMRAGALYRGYSASIEAYGHLNHVFNKPHEKEVIDFSKMGQSNPVRVCVGKEWYRFPSSFFIPDYIAEKNKKRKVELHFIQSNFKGILPKHFEAGKVPEITRAIPTEMNDQNLEEPSRYVPLETCDYLIDLETPDVTELEPNYAKQKEFKSIYEKSFLLPHRSHWLFRAFYVPYFSETKNEYGTYHVLERV